MDEDKSLAERIAHLETRVAEIEGKPVVYCSFCKKSQYMVEKIVAGEGVFICNECIDACQSVIAPKTTEE
jgi:hypothetical protein